jgi:DNA/RNA-binding domain of Phe-tRNA-synthetase-like protein
MKLVISEKIREKYPDLRIGVVVAHNVINDNEDTTELDLFVIKKFKDFQRQYPFPENLAVNKNIICWQDVYRSFGTNPKKRRPTAEALLLRVIKQDFIPHINPAVDCYLAAEPVHCLPIGGYDLDRINGDIVLKISQGGESFLGVGADKAEETDDHEVIYADDDRVLTRRWNYRDCDYAKIDSGSKSIALFVEAPEAVITTDEISETIMQIASNLRDFCSGETITYILKKDENELDLQ